MEDKKLQRYHRLDWAGGISTEYHIEESELPGGKKYLNEHMVIAIDGGDSCIVAKLESYGCKPEDLEALGKQFLSLAEEAQKIKAAWQELQPA